jgi:putative toxin-antitoxin system antitoxin component (TIGR02293 family)
MQVLEHKIEEKLNREISQVIKQSKSINKVFISHPVTYLEFFKNKLLIVQVIKEGIPYSFFANIQSYTPFTENDWSNYLSISTKSLHRYKSAPKRFKPIHTEKIIELAEVTNLGVEVFNDIDKFRLWLNTSNYALGNTSPKDLLGDSYGKELVIGELTRIKYGILA